MNITTTALKTTLATLGYKDVKNLSATAFGVVVAKTKVDKLIPELAKAFAPYKPEIVSNRELRIGDKTIFAKNREQQRGITKFTMGRGNEYNLLQALKEWIADYGKPLTVRFTQEGRKRFAAEEVTGVLHTGSKNIFQRLKADIHLVTPSRNIPLSIKDESASYWESADTYWGVKSEKFLKWALANGVTKLEDNGAGGFSLRPPVAVPATDVETRDVVFGTDILSHHGAVIVKKFTNDSFQWNYKDDVLEIECKEVILEPKDVKGPHEVFFEIRNEKGRNPAHLCKGLRAMAAMKRAVQYGDKVLDASARRQAGI